MKTDQNLKMNTETIVLTETKSTELKTMIETKINTMTKSTELETM